MSSTRWLGSAAPTLEGDAALGAALQGLDVGERGHAGGVERAPGDREGVGEVRVDRGAHVLQDDRRHERERERAVPERGGADRPGELAAAERAAGERERASSVRHGDPEVRRGRPRPRRARLRPGPLGARRAPRARSRRSRPSGLAACRPARSRPPARTPSTSPASARARSRSRVRSSAGTVTSTVGPAPSARARREPVAPGRRSPSSSRRSDTVNVFASRATSTPRRAAPSTSRRAPRSRVSRGDEASSVACTAPWPSVRASRLPSTAADRIVSAPAGPSASSRPCVSRPLHPQRGGAREGSRRDPQVALGRPPPIGGGGHPHGDRVPGDVGLRRQLREGDHRPAGAEDVEPAVDDLGGQARRLSSQRVDDRAERFAVGGERIARAATGPEAHLENGLLHADLGRTDGSGERRERAPGAGDPQGPQRAGPHDVGHGPHAVDVTGQPEGALTQAGQVERGQLELEGRCGAVGVRAQGARRSRHDVAQLEPAERHRQRLRVAGHLGGDAHGADRELPRATLQDELRRRGVDRGPPAP